MSISLALLVEDAAQLVPQAVSGARVRDLEAIDAFNRYARTSDGRQSYCNPVRQLLPPNVARDEPRGSLAARFRSTWGMKGEFPHHGGDIVLAQRGRRGAPAKARARTARPGRQHDD